MAVGVKTELKGAVEYSRQLTSLIPSKNPKIRAVGLRALALEVQTVSAREKIKRGGKGAPLKSKLTSRTGTGRRSIRTDFSRLPGQSAVGTDLRYMAAHEKGGAFSVKASTVSAHTRTKAFGKTVKPFKVPKYKRKAYTLNLPKRPFIEPAVDQVVPSRAQQIFLRAWEKLGAAK